MSQTAIYNGLFTNMSNKKISHWQIVCKIWWIKATHWEYWSMSIVYFLSVFYYLYLSIKARSFFFFSASNPSIETGGMFFESKWQVLKLIPTSYYPKTIFVSEQSNITQIQSSMQQAHIGYPCIVKPDRGERGWAVKKISNQQQLLQYINQHTVDVLIQEFIDYPVEVSVFYKRMPNQQHGQVIGLTGKQLLNIVGDGHSTIEELIVQNNRALVQYFSLQKNEDIQFDEVLPAGTTKTLVELGNHSKGAMFLNWNHHINQALNHSFNKLCLQIPMFYYGRFDIRCKSIEHLQQGKDFYILELNGAGAEPAHIYDPHFSFVQGQRTLFNHFKNIYQIAKINHSLGIGYMSLSACLQQFKNQKKYKQKVCP